MNADFTLDAWTLRNKVRHLNGDPFDPAFPGTCLGTYTPAPGESRLIRILPAKKGHDRPVTNALGKFYLAGPMRGYPLFNFPAFLMAARVLTARGFEISSPAEKDLEAGFDPSLPIEGQKFDVGAAFRWDFEAVVKSRGIVLLPGWERSTGAKAERLVAQLSELEVYVLDERYVLTEAPPADYTLTWTPKAVEVLPARIIES